MYVFLENHILIINDQILHLHITFSEMFKQNVKMHENIRILDTCPSRLLRRFLRNVHL